MDYGRFSRETESWSVWIQLPRIQKLTNVGSGIHRMPCGGGDRLGEVRDRLYPRRDR